MPPMSLPGPLADEVGPRRAEQPDVVFLSDRRIRDIPVLDGGAALVDLAVVGIAVVDRPGGGRTHAKVRAPLAARLALADQLLPRRHRLLVAEGWRPAAEQARIWSTYEKTVRSAHPEADEVELGRLTSRFVAPIGVAGHVSGSAIDVTIVGPDGLLDMGTAIDATPERSGGACYFAHPGISVQARNNRALLARVLRLAGLVNYPTEWWHWSFGDRYWAWTTGAPCALFGPLEAEPRS